MQSLDFRIAPTINTRNNYVEGHQSATRVFVVHLVLNFGVIAQFLSLAYVCAVCSVNRIPLLTFAL
jgi:hypothetical protein